MKRRIACILFLLITCISYNNAKENNKTPFYMYNNKGAKDFEKIQIISKFDKSKKYLIPHLKYEFTYNSENKVVKKEAFRWNIPKQIWEQNFHLKYSYQDNLLIIEYAHWEPQKKRYTPYTKKATYHIYNNRFTIYKYYTRKSFSEDDWVLEKNSTNTSYSSWNEENPYIVKRDK